MNTSNGIISNSSNYPDYTHQDPAATPSSRNKPNQTQSPVLNKKVINIQFLKKTRHKIKRLPTSLYEASLKRLKKRHSYQGKEEQVAHINLLKRQLQDKQKKMINLNNSLLPNLNSQTPTRTRYNQPFFLRGEKEKQPYRKTFNKSVTLDRSKQEQQPLFVFKNLKEKYLKLRILEQQKHKASLSPVQNIKQLEDLPMENSSEQYMQKRGAKVKNRTFMNGFKFSMDSSKSTKRSSLLQSYSGLQNQLLCNDVKRKELKSRLFYPVTRQRTNRFQTNISPAKLDQSYLNSDIQCSPWKTDTIPFD